MGVVVTETAAKLSAVFKFVMRPHFPTNHAGKSGGLQLFNFKVPELFHNIFANEVPY